MAKKNYQAEVGKPSKSAKALITDANISIKYATEIANQIKSRPVNQVIDWLIRIERHEEYLPLKRYHKKVAHRKGDSREGVKSGRYPEKAVQAFINLLKLAKNNADFKGLDSEKLVIIHAFVSMGTARYGYQSKGKIAGKARRHNSTHIEVIVQEVKA
ncbi:MAG: 50S ribosomal protein L22 [archaeon]